MQPVDEVVEPDEVLPPVSGPAGDGGYERWGALKRLERAFGPIIAGLLIDFLDLATFGPIGVFTGMIVGGTAAYWVCTIYGMPVRQRMLWALAAGVYCTIPFTEVFPLATLLGAYARFRRPIDRS